MNAQKYLVNKKTLCIIPSYDCYNNLNSVVIEKGMEHSLHFQSKPFDIIRYSCNYYGKDYELQKQGSKSIFDDKYVLPISINDQGNLFFLATRSHNVRSTYWISHQHVDSYHKSNSKKTVITFVDGQKIEVPISKKSFENKLLLASQIQAILTRRNQSMD